MDDLKTIFQSFASGQAISTEDFTSIFTEIMSGNLSDAQISAFLLGLEITGISPEILTEGTAIMRAKMSSIDAPKRAIDIVGTGGDGHATYNISTASCFVVAGAGVPVAKHGNRAVSSLSGASEVLRALGVKLDIPTQVNEACLKDAGVTFLFAPNHHPAMRHVGPARAALKIGTILNRLGPLSNPAEVEYYLLGVYDDELRKLYAKTLLALGTKRALIVHGEDGMDEITTTGKTNVSEIKDGQISDYEIAPEDFGLKRVSLADIKGGDPNYNAKALLTVLDGIPSAYADIVLLNSGAALYVAGQASSIKDGVDLARTSIKSGQAKTALEALIRISNA